jgi:hypothetical protein
MKAHGSSPVASTVRRDNDISARIVPGTRKSNTDGAGQFLVNFYLLESHGGPNFKGDGQMGIVLGGFSVAPP